MNRAFLTAVISRRPLIKQRWRAALRQTLTRTPLANPELLAYMIDETLDELLYSPGRGTAAFLAHTPASATEFRNVAEAIAHSSCRCSLNPYIDFFLAGESALLTVIREISESEKFTQTAIQNAEIQLLFGLRVLGHREVNAFCEICRIERPSSASPSGNVPTEICPLKLAELAASNLCSDGELRRAKG